MVLPVIASILKKKLLEKPMDFVRNKVMNKLSNGLSSALSPKTAIGSGKIKRWHRKNIDHTIISTHHLIRNKNKNKKVKRMKK